MRQCLSLREHSRRGNAASHPDCRAAVYVQMLKEHGTSEVFVWPSARAARVPVIELLAKSAPRPRKSPPLD